MQKSKNELEINPGESSPRKGDLVALGNYQVRWLVQMVQGGTLYLRSELGNRFETAPAGRISAIWRDPSYEAEIDWRSFYDGNFEWLEEESGG